METVFVVTTGNYDLFQVEAAFSTKEKAEQFIDRECQGMTSYQRGMREYNVWRYCVDKHEADCGCDSPARTQQLFQ